MLHNLAQQEGHTGTVQGNGHWNVSLPAKR